MKEFARQADIDLRLVEFTGPGGRPNKITAGLYTGGTLDARVDGDRWCFRFRLNGLPDDILKSDREELSQLVLEDMAEFVTRPPKGCADTTETPEHRILFLRTKDGKIKADFTTKKQDSMDDLIELSAQARWWE